MIKRREVGRPEEQGRWRDERKNSRILLHRAGSLESGK